jgi:phosphohistidine phosphatase
MRLILVRHATAWDIGEQGIASDFDRSLSDRGRREARNLTKTLESLGVTLNAVVSSPLVRAVQTAQFLQSLVLDSPAEMLTCRHLSTTDFRAKKATKFLNALGLETVAIVGHMPDLGDYAAWLLGATKTTLPFEKAGAAHISFDGEVAKGEGMLNWFVTPEWFRTEGSELGKQLEVAVL